jgi:aminoglycoside phosphotransferase (APT) family kinase protein
MSTPEANTGTKPVAEQHAFDVAALERYLTGRLAGFSGPLQVEQFKGGQSNPTYRLATPSRSYVMRSKPGPSARLLASAHAVEREFRVMSALHGTGVPVPEMLLLCEDESVIGRAFYLMQFVDGRVLWDQSLPGFDPAGRTQIYDEMNRVIAALHTVDPVAVGLGDYGKPGNCPSARSAAGPRYQASITEPIGDGAADRMASRAHRRAPDDSRVSVVHGDYRLKPRLSSDRRASSPCSTGSSRPAILGDFATACRGTSSGPSWRARHRRSRSPARFRREQYVRRYCDEPASPMSSGDGH